MSGDRSDQALSRFAQALMNFERALTLPPEDEDYRNSAILAFMMAEETMWKTLKYFLKTYIGIEVNGPKPVLQEAYAQGWLGQDDMIWLAMVDDRNNIVHVYNKSLAEKIYHRLPAYAHLLRGLHDHLEGMAKVPPAEPEL